MARGKEGAEAILEYVRGYPGKIIGIASPGGGRLEPVLAALLGVELDAVGTRFEAGSVAILTFESDCLLDVDYLGNLGRQ